ncbi:integrase core domain-containing protein [Lysinibacillus sp. ZYM-1]|uniref:integrase core domain-containing protein n=1 Tax=Lysinibacillus sp. ZYM-1 TaxID=1681184 RepID=UPI0021012C56|nr:integrase core domain-containing protein [Lysinibacillus sp. ZYM-1]
MGCQASMSRRGNCWDNAVIESFHSNIKTEAFERVKHHSFTNEVTRLRVMEYMREYNEERIQEKLGYLTPLEFGKQAA